MNNLQDFLALLERNKQLARVRVEADPELEVGEVAMRTVKQQGPALLFERVKGSPYPLAINILGSDQRIEWLLGRSPQQVGDELRRLLEAAMPPRPKQLIQEWRTVGRVLSMPPKRAWRAPCQEVKETPALNTFPIMKCWPKDAGRFITCGMVLTRDPHTGARNLGIYRMQVVGPDRVLMHWQIQKGGGFHYWKAEQAGQPLPVSVVIGGDPILYLAAVAPLPEGIDELAFAGFLRGRRVGLAPGLHGSSVPAGAEIVLEGLVPPRERFPEGPFGDHFGHYSHPAPFPMLHIERVTRRASPVYQAAVVGKPPQEDRYIGNAVQEMLLPMIRLIHPEIKDVWAYYEAGFHSLAVISVTQRFGKEGMKAALGLLGTGQMALTKCVVLVDADVDARDPAAVLRAIREQFDPSRDFLLLPGVPFDTLDFTSFTLNVGSKMVLDATRDGQPPRWASEISPEDVKRLHPRILASRLVGQGLLLVQAEGEGRPVLEAVVRSPQVAKVPLAAVVSPDVDLHDRESFLWGLFTRFDPARDVLFAQSTLQGSWPVYRGCLGIDATFKTGYPDTVAMDPAVAARVTERWGQYWS